VTFLVLGKKRIKQLFAWDYIRRKAPEENKYYV
jgi:hypothetical protein